MDSQKLEKLKEFARAYPNRKAALSAWINLKVKTFRLVDALECIYDHADGDFARMDSIIETLTKKRKTYGRTQVHAGPAPADADIITNADGTLSIVGISK